MADKSSLGYLPETSQEAIDLNRAQQEALARLNEALDVRKNRVFDPRWAAAAQGFFAPTRTGHWSEALGNVIGNVSKADEAMALEEQNIAKAKFDVASQNVMLGRQKMAMQPYIDRMQGKTQTAGAPASGGTPEGPMSRDEFIMQQLVRGKTPIEAETEYAKYIQDVIQVNDQGSFNRFTNKFTPHRFKADEMTITVPGPNGVPEERKVDSELASQILEARRDGDLEKYNRLVAIARNPLAAFQQGALPSAAATPSVGALPPAPVSPSAGTLPVTSPQASAATAPLSAVSPTTKPPISIPELPAAPNVNQKLEEQRRLDVEKANQTRLAEKRAETSAAREAELPKIEQNARLLYGSATRVIDNVTKSPNYFGLFERPGFVAAIGTLVDNLKGTKEGSVERGAVEKAMRQVMPGVEQTDLDTVTNTAAELANIELAYTQLYLTNQGAVTEGERRIVGKLGGSTSNSPNVLKARMQLLKERSQYDIDRVDAFRQWQEKNPSGTIDQFERSKESKDLKTAFEVRLSKVFGGAPAIPSRERKASEQTKPKDNLEDLRKKLDKWRSSNE